jgi:hypothetical protein
VPASPRALVLAAICRRRVACLRRRVIPLVAVACSSSLSVVSGPSRTSARRLVAAKGNDQENEGRSADGRQDAKRLTVNRISAQR